MAGRRCRDMGFPEPSAATAANCTRECQLLSCQSHQKSANGALCVAPSLEQEVCRTLLERGALGENPLAMWRPAAVAVGAVLVVAGAVLVAFRQPPVAAT